jgi:hypothetical protein
MTYILLACTVANAIQAILYHRMEGKFQTTFWCLTAICGGLFALTLS